VNIQAILWVILLNNQYMIYSCQIEVTKQYIHLRWLLPEISGCAVTKVTAKHPIHWKPGTWTLFKSLWLSWMLIVIQYLDSVILGFCHICPWCNSGVGLWFGYGGNSPWENVIVCILFCHDPAIPNIMTKCCEIDANISTTVAFSNLGPKKTNTHVQPAPVALSSTLRSYNNILVTEYDWIKVPLALNLARMAYLNNISQQQFLLLIFLLQHNASGWQSKITLHPLGSANCDHNIATGTYTSSCTRFMYRSPSQLDVLSHRGGHHWPDTFDYVDWLSGMGKLTPFSQKYYCAFTHPILL